jgi:hypothetical protein
MQSMHNSRRRARAFENVVAEHDWVAVPPAARSALEEWRKRAPPQPMGFIPVNPHTDGPAILRRVLAEPVDDADGECGDVTRANSRSDSI